jgi:hypothetical protein
MSRFPRKTCRWPDGASADDVGEESGSLVYRVISGAAGRTKSGPTAQLAKSIDAARAVELAQSHLTVTPGMGDWNYCYRTATTKRRAGIISDLPEIGCTRPATVPIIHRRSRTAILPRWHHEALVGEE